MSRIKLVTVEDSVLLASTLEKCLKDSNIIDYRGNYSTPEEFLNRVVGDRFIDILLIDVLFTNSNMDGLQLAEELRRRNPFSEENGKISAPRIIFSSVGSRGYVDLKNGIHGLISKGADIEKVINKIVLVHEERAIFPPKESSMSKGLPSFWIELTKRQREIFCLVMQGKTTDQIAEELKPSKLDIAVIKSKIRKKIKKFGIKIEKITDPKIVKLLSGRREKVIFWTEFTDKERKIVDHLIQGKSTEDLAELLKLSNYTISTQRRNILEKMKDSGLEVDSISDPRVVKLILDHKLCEIGSLKSS